MAIAFLALFVAFIVIFLEGNRTEDEHVELLGLFGIGIIVFISIFGIIGLVVCTLVELIS
jgi:hypothetical protein